MVDARFYSSIGDVELFRLLQICELATTDYSTQQLRHKINDVAPLEKASANQASFATKRQYLSQLSNSKAGVIFVTQSLKEDAPSSAIAIVCANPYGAFVKILDHLFPASNHHLSHRPQIPHLGEPVYEADVIVDASAVIGSGVEIGRGSVIGPNTVIAPGVKIGRNCIIADNVTLECALIGDNVIINSGARIGAKGFGWLDHGKANIPIPQVGRTILQSHVEIGANTTVDRGALGDTIIGENTKLGAMVEIGHNTIIGSNCLLAPKVGLAGSTIVGDGVLMGAEVGSAGHLSIGSGSVLYARTAIIKDCPPGSKLVGAPAQNIKEFWREQAQLRKLLKGLSK